jgi:hypothetical protein
MVRDDGYASPDDEGEFDPPARESVGDVANLLPSFQVVAQSGSERVRVGRSGLGLKQILLVNQFGMRLLPSPHVLPRSIEDSNVVFSRDLFGQLRPQLSP